MNRRSVPISPTLVGNVQQQRAPHNVCRRCNAPIGNLPFCLRDGTIAVHGGFRIGRYVVEEFLGGGGTALVFGARHDMLGKAVAIKVLRHELASDAVQAERFLRGARLASQLQHPNIVTVHDFGRDDAYGLIYLVMDRLSGPTLAQTLERTGPLGIDRAVVVLRQLANALDHAHARGVVHRDIHPGNIVLEEISGRSDFAKLCDFGLSKLVDADDRITISGAVIGTPAYMAPEQIRGMSMLGPRVDLYSLGVTAYEMLSGTLPHSGSTFVAMISNRLSAAPVPLRTHLDASYLPDSVERVVMRCLAEDPTERPESAAEVEESLLGLRVAETTRSSISSSGRIALPVDLTGTMIGSYHVLSLLGSGGVASVYLGEHPVIGNRVAIKVLHPEFATRADMCKRFIEEARACDAIASPHIPRYHDFGALADGRHYAVMEYLEGWTLEAQLAERGPLDLAAAVTIASQIAEAMADAHAHGIVHCDLKPANIFLTSEGVKVLDFGIARAMHRPEVSPSGHGGFLGSPAQCAPEQIAGGELGATTDVYALGSTIFEMLTGRAPFDGDVGDIFRAKVERPAPSVRELRSDLPPRVAQTIARMLARHPSERIASMVEVRREIAGWLEREQPSADSTAELRALILKPNPWPLRLVAAGAAFVLLLGALSVAVWASTSSSSVESDPTTQSE